MHKLSKKDKFLLVLTLLLLISAGGMVFISLGNNATNFTQSLSNLLRRDGDKISPDEREQISDPSFVFNPTEDSVPNAEIIKDVAENVDTLSIKDCIIDPLAVKAVRGEIVKIKNDGRSEQTLYIGDTKTTLASGETLDFNTVHLGFILDIAKEADQKEVYVPIICNDSENFAGYIVLTDK